MRYALLALALALVPCAALAQAPGAPPLHPAEEKLHGYSEGHVRMLAPSDVQPAHVAAGAPAESPTHLTHSHVTHTHHEGRVQVRYDANTRSGQFSTPAGICSFQVGVAAPPDGHSGPIHGALNVNCPDVMGSGTGGWTLAPDHRIHAHLKTSKGYELNITLNNN